MAPGTTYLGIKFNMMLGKFLFASDECGGETGSSKYPSVGTS